MVQVTKHSSEWCHSCNSATAHETNLIEAIDGKKHVAGLYLCNKCLKILSTKLQKLFKTKK